MKASMNIAHVLSSFGMGGQERVALDLAREQVAAGHKVLAISIAPGAEGPSGADFRAARVPTETIAKALRVDPSLPFRIATRLRGHGVDVVHTHNPHALIYGAPAARLASAVAIHTKHGTNPDRPRRLWLRQAAARLVDAHVAVTPTLAAMAVEQGDCVLSRNRVIPNGIDIERFAPNAAARSRVRAQLGIGRDVWLVGTVGRLAREKDQALLIDAMAPLLNERRQLVLAGDGPERNALMTRIAGAGLDLYVRMLGARGDVEDILASLDAFALSSRTEGLPLALLEAMATGLPVVCTAVGGILDLVRHQMTGLLCPAGDRPALTRHLESLCDDPALARRLGQAGRSEVLARHSVARMAREYAALYESVLSEKRRSPRRGLARLR